MKNKKQYFILELESYEGESSELQCFIQSNFEKRMFCIARLNEDGSLEIDDYGYKTEEEAKTMLPKEPKQGEFELC